MHAFSLWWSRVPLGRRGELPQVRGYLAKDLPEHDPHRPHRGNPAGRLRGSRNKLSEAVICALLRDFSKHGEKAIAKVRRTQPAAYLKILALLVPREMKLEHSGGVKAMTDEQLERGIEILQELIAKRDADANAKVIEGEAEVVPSLPAPVMPTNAS